MIFYICALNINIVTFWCGAMCLLFCTYNKNDSFVNKIYCLIYCFIYRVLFSRINKIIVCAIECYFTYNENNIFVAIFKTNA